MIKLPRIPKDELFLMCSFCIQLALLIFILSMVGCGGGSEGTGSANTLVGTVNLAERGPIEGAVITVAETGQTAVTDREGKFTIDTPTGISDVTLEVSASSIDGDVVVSNLPANPGTVSVEINVNPETNEVEATQVNARAGVIGACNPLFENNKTSIRQGVGVADGTECLVKVTLRANGRALRGVEVAIQFRACDEALPWNTQSIAVTNKDVHAGITQIPFTFYNSPEYCEYQIVAPFNNPRYQPVIFPILTFQKQAISPER